MRVLLVNTLYPPSRVGGAERSVQLLARGLAAGGHDVFVACVAEQPEITVEHDGDVEVHRLPLRNRHWPYDTATTRSASERLRWHARDHYNRSARDDLCAVIDRVRPDVINTNNLTGFSTEVWRSAASRSLPVAHTLRDYSLVCSRATLFTNGSNCERRCAPCWALTLRKRQNSALVDHVIGISAAVVEGHRKFGCFEGIDDDVIHNIAATDLPPTSPELSGDMVFGMLGRVETEKGVDVLLAASRLLGDRPHRIRIGGTGAPGDIDRLQRSFGARHIEWLGHVDADDFFSSIDTLVVPAIWAEPMGRTVIEAAVRGVSVIHSDAGGIPEVAALARQRMQVAAGDPAALSAAMADVLANPGPWRRRNVVGPHALEPFSTDHVVRSHVEVFDRLLSK